VIAAAGAALGAPLPVAPNRAAGDAPRALWTGPLEWTLIDAPSVRLAALRQALGGSLAHYADLTGGRVGFRITGAAAADLIESECPLDVRAMAAATCAQSLFAGVGVLIERREGEDGLRLYADSSLAEHLAAWLAAAAEGLA
jgi:heterotetrameric sarcosine oxidase gamma subunit